MMFQWKRWVEDVAERPNRNAGLSSRSGGRPTRLCSIISDSFRFTCQISTTSARLICSTAGLLDWRVNWPASKPVRTYTLYDAGRVPFSTYLPTDGSVEKICTCHFLQALRIIFWHLSVQTTSLVSPRSRVRALYLHFLWQWWQRHR